MSYKKQKSKKSFLIWILLPVIISAGSAASYYLLKEWRLDSRETSETETTSPPVSIIPTPQITSPPSTQLVSETPAPTFSKEPTPTLTSTSEPEPTPTSTHETLPSTTTVPTVTYQPPTPSPSSPAESDENYGFNPETIIEFENMNIKDGINDTLAAMGYPRKEVITISDLLKLESLIIIPREEGFDESEINCCREYLGNITIIKNDYPWNLDFLRYAKNLKAIYCFNNEISKISAISNLENLIYVGFPECNINSLSFLENLHLLTGINFNHNMITTVMPIRDMEYLRSIRLVGNLLYNLNPFEEAEYPDINDVWIWGNRITDISPISSITNLKWLAIGENDIADLSPLLELAYLKEIYIDRNQESAHSDVFDDLKNRGCKVTVFD